MHHPITNSRIIGKHPDGTPARMWTEGPRVFIEGYGYSAPAASGTRYGAIQVREITPTFEPDPITAYYTDRNNSGQAALAK